MWASCSRGVDTNGNSTANNITLTEGEIICRDAAGGIAINAIEAQFTVEKCDIGYGNASAGIVIGAHADNTRIVNSRFEWDSQTSGVYPISIATNSFFNYMVGNIYTDGCQIPNVYDANGANARYQQLDAYAHFNDIPWGSPVFDVPLMFRQNPIFAGELYIPRDANSVLGIAKANNDSISASARIPNWCRS